MLKAIGKADFNIIPCKLSLHPHKSRKESPRISRCAEGSTGEDTVTHPATQKTSGSTGKVTVKRLAAQKTSGSTGQVTVKHPATKQLSSSGGACAGINIPRKESVIRIPTGWVWTDVRSEKQRSKELKSQGRELMSHGCVYPRLELFHTLPFRDLLGTCYYFEVKRDDAKKKKKSNSGDDSTSSQVK